ncbi:peptidase M48 Ste24p family protein [Nitzschia inconspicua]|uniref:Peptidase M48 Ste24p family protein n=1 Tax=Nitzschia inconspicua TaxID=303405 RepID=A0A9K3L1E3_9STRA|nr:peptidase M48 Ste24p family protein [Nitzschia inconspicua]
MLSIVSPSAVRAVTTSSFQKIPSSPSSFLWRTFHASSSAHRKHFAIGGTPRRVRFNLAPEQQQQQQRSSLAGGGSHHYGQRKYPTYLYVGGGVVAIGGIGMYFHYQNFAPMTHRRRWIASSPEFEKEIGDENYQQLLQQYAGNILPKHHPATMAIEKIGGRIFQAAGEFAREYNLDYFDTKNVTFTVVDTDQANAFVLPGNHVFFLSGMFKYAQTEDEIGGILGHEMAHNLARHQGEKISTNAVVGILARLTLFLDPTGGYLLLFLPATQLLASLPNSRNQETEADNIGMYLAAKACYDPEALGRVFKRMDEAGSDGSDKNLALKPPEFLSTHPSDDTRIKNMQKWLPRDNKIFHQDEGERCRSLRRQIEVGNKIFQAATNISGPDGLPQRHGWM